MLLLILYIFFYLVGFCNYLCAGLCIIICTLEYIVLPFSKLFKNLEFLLIDVNPTDAYYNCNLTRYKWASSDS